jgi:integrase
MSLYRRSDTPNWWVRFHIDGREVRLSTGTADKKKASAFESVARGEAWKQSKLGERSPYLWADAHKRWLAETQKRTKAKDKTILEWFDKHLSSQSVQSITREVIDELRALRAAESSKSTADRYMALVRAVLRKCVNDWQVLASAPKVPMYRPKPTEPRFLSHDEFARLCKELPEHLKVAARFAVLTGLRMRSMLAMTWDRIDLKAATAWIPGEHMKAGRTHGLTLSPDAVKVLKDLRRFAPHGNSVFQYEGVQIADANTAAFKKAVKRANVGPLRWHDLRHTWASWAVQNGATLQEVMQLGGWASYTMVLRYAHLAPDHLAAAAALVTLKKPRTKTGTAKRPRSETRSTA